jgi:integrase
MMNPEPYYFLDPRNNRIKIRQNHANGRQVVVTDEYCTSGWLAKKKRPKDPEQTGRLMNLMTHLNQLSRVLEAKGYVNPPLKEVWQSQFDAVEPDAPKGNQIVDWCKWRASLSGYHYKRGYLNIIAHLKDWGKPNALLVNINESWVNSYCKYLNERGLKTSSINKSMAYLRSVVKSARTNNAKVGVIPDRLKKSVVGGKRSTVKIPLDFGEVQKLYALNKLPRHLEVIRDMFVLMCFTGVRIGDLLNPDWIITRDRIHNQQAKTGRNHVITLNPYSLAIIKKYSTIGMDGNLIINLPDHEGQYLNRQYKKLALMIHTKKTITNHIARHTFARLLSDMGISESLRASELGHKANASVTSGYGNMDADFQVKMVAKRWDKVIGLWNEVAKTKNKDREGDYEKWYEAVNS